MGRVRELHGGQDYASDWGRRLTGEGAFADLLRHRFAIAVKRLGLSVDLPDLRRDLFQPPLRKGDQTGLVLTRQIPAGFLR